tara:strand:+ start:667 stop:1035 length:369 start_codon:yes stop_codon:yes gene_type:complete
MNDKQHTNINTKTLIMSKLRKCPNKAIQNRINAINEMLPMVQKQSTFATTMAGSTYESYVILTGPIEVKNQFVYIHEDKGYHAYGFEKRYNVNREEGFGSLEQLKYDLSIIKRAFNKLIKNQ